MLTRAMRLKHDGSSTVRASIELPGSKSLSNRYLIIRVVANTTSDLKGLSNARDTRLLMEALSHPSNEHYFADGATPFRFFLAYAAAAQHPALLTGNQSLYKRSIAPLVETLSSMGAELSYQDQKGFPPIAIKKGVSHFTDIRVQRDISSQFVSALMLVAPVFEGAKTIRLEGPARSGYAYIRMTAYCMAACGVAPQIDENNILIPEGKYILPKTISVEADWSSAAWFYMLCACVPNSEIHIANLQKQSFQGDSKLSDFFERLGVETAFHTNEIVLNNAGRKISEIPIFDLLNNIDLAPALVCTCAFLEIPALFEGLDNLQYKESDRLETLNLNLALFGWQLVQIDKHWQLQKTGAFLEQNTISIRTFSDHRIAMAFAIFALKHTLMFDDATCVEKSFPGFWAQWQKCNFVMDQYGE